MIWKRFFGPCFPGRMFFAVGCVLSIAAMTQGSDFSLLFDEGDGETIKVIGNPQLEGVVKRAKWGEGTEGKALVFNDYGNKLVNPQVSEATYVTIPHDDALVPKEAITINVDVWLDRTPFYYGGIIEKGVGFGSSYRLLVLRNGKLRASVGNKLLSIETPEPLPLEKWVKITMRFQKGVLSLAIDGAQVSEKKGDVESFASDHPLVLGTRFTGKVDNLLIQLDPE